MTSHSLSVVQRNDYATVVDYCPELMTGHGLYVRRRRFLSPEHITLDHEEERSFQTRSHVGQRMTSHSLSVVQRNEHADVELCLS